ncbi:MAG: hypothetical protein A3H27_09430 [Acidobacteria bacterium RIFCSPLOWO2_02_FULL_59_13]|nr:MAG: hypothetical protein A3H27_09430 [Acidobacteria bacterium RIFCSPLOWO2_02_FULL_59_13]
MNERPAKLSELVNLGLQSESAGWTICPTETTSAKFLKADDLAREPDLQTNRRYSCGISN